MRKLVIVGLVGCWSSTQPAAPPPAEPASASLGGATYGGLGYGGDEDEPARPVLLTGEAGDGSGPSTGTSDAILGATSPGQTGLGGVFAGPGTPTATGSLAKADIQHGIRSKVGPIRHCYETQLLTNPALAGRVMVDFTIGVDGRVMRAVGSGMPTVDACVAGVVATIVFPRPTGGGLVTVRYPFLFNVGP